MCTHTHTHIHTQVLCPLNCVEISRIQFRIINFSHMPLSQECFNGDIELQSCCQRFLPNSLLGALLLIYFFFFKFYYPKWKICYQLKDDFNIVFWSMPTRISHECAYVPSLLSLPLTPLGCLSPFGFRVTASSRWLAGLHVRVCVSRLRSSHPLFYPSPHCSLYVGSSVPSF